MVNRVYIQPCSFSDVNAKGEIDVNAYYGYCIWDNFNMSYSDSLTEDEMYELVTNPVSAFKIVQYDWNDYNRADFWSTVEGYGMYVCSTWYSWKEIKRMLKEDRDNRLNKIKECINRQS